MRITGSQSLPPAVTHARSPGRPDTAGPAQSTPPSAPVPTQASETEAPAESGKAQGLVRAAEHSHRSDVAALRQWINHPELRGDLPDLSAEHQGDGFARAVAAYEAVIAIGNPPPVTDPAPVTTEPAPVVSDPDPVVSEPDPVVSVPDPVVSDPDPRLDVLLPQQPTPGAVAEPA